ncbi:TetR family transcriptional regulator [Tamaricihabitans halophyticus]|uniref:TetR family transcriptional regulator n=1 Tax=Tamaricihabitans halophyticus TaxID=1262583 RepID=A0A4R2QA41_9PSEU|nr:TetR/AcrR family transcriptional regulator [Tamaricihabitans halophyticus]TCP45790.1 TetR family transcriptional regulator [Tamaricihabitans halophyticus]
MDEDGIRARIREAAFEEFTAHGFKGATVRGIAEAAGVSLGMVQRHFPSKDELRRACDTHVLAVLREVRDSVIAVDAAPGGALPGTAQQAVARLAPYLAMALLRDNGSTAEWFDELTELYGTTLTSGGLGITIPADEDAEAVMAVHAAMQMGLTVFVDQVCRRLGGAELDAEMAYRIGRARLFLASEQLVSPEHADRIRESLARHAAEGGTAQ